MERGVRILNTAIILLVIGITAQAQPALIKEIPNTSTDFTRVGDLVYYVSGSALYRTDGTEDGTILLKDGLHFISWQRQLAGFNGLLFFVSKWTSSTGYQEIWRSDGTPSGTFMLRSSSAFNVQILGGAGKYLYFKASEPVTGSEIYRTDGSPSGTILLKDVNPGVSSGAGDLLKAVGDVMFFSANDGVHGMELWRTNGSNTGTVMVKDINSGPSDGIGGSIPTVFNNKLYFSGINSETGAEAWISDGTSVGTVLLKDLVPGEDYAGFIEYTTDHQGSLYFFSSPLKESGTDAITVDLWKTGGTPASTSKIKSLNRCGFCNNIEDYRIYDDKLYFFLNESHGREILWTTDGTEGGTVEIFSLPTHGTLPFFDVVNGYLLFFAGYSTTATPFYRSDGTAGGTEIFHSFKSSGNNSYGSADDIPVIKIGDKIYFPDHDGPTNDGYATNQKDAYQLMQSDGFSVQSMRSIAGGSYDGTGNLVNLNNKLLFTTTTGIDLDREMRLWIFEPSQPIESRGKFTLINADTDEDITTLNEGDVITKPQGAHYNIRYDPATQPGSVVFKHQEKVVRRENGSPYSIAGDYSGDYLIWANAVAGNHKVEAIPYSGSSGTGTAGPSLVVNFEIKDEMVTCQSSGSILREYWEGVSGNQVSSIPVQTEPDATSQLTLFEGPSNVGTNYGSRIRGYICIPVTGEYIFWIASNDHSELWLSTDDKPANKNKIAYVSGATNPRQWDKFPSQKSAAIVLEAGKRYYIEALHKQGVGTDHISVGWQLPNDVMDRPIQGYRLSPFSGQLTPTVTVTSPEEGQTFNEPADLTISGTVEGFRGGSVAVDLYAGSLHLGTTYDHGGGTFAFDWRDVEAGAYPLRAVASDFTGATTTSEIVNIIVEAPCTARGVIDREHWSGVQGNRISDIPLNEPPTGSTELSVFETEASGTNYGARIRGFICPPSTGDYIFWIASNDHSELWISTNDDPANKQRIAYVTGATNFHQWNKFSSQRSAPVALIQGKKYYIEALHKQGIGTDHLSVGWQLPGGAFERPIGGNRLSPFNQQNDLESFIIYPEDGAFGIDPLVVKLETRRVVGADRYTVELSTTPDFSGAPISMSSAEDFQSRFIFKDLESGTTYFTRVKSDASGYGPVRSFTTRDEIHDLRLWGLTTAGGADDLGTIFSYSIADNSFIKHYDQQLVPDGYDGYYDQRLMGTLVPGPDGVAYGHSDHAYTGNLFTLHPDGSVETWPATYFSESQLLLASNNNLYVTHHSELGPGLIQRYDVEQKMLTGRIDYFADRSNGDDLGSPLIELEDGYLYGAAGDGAMNNGGLLYRVRRDGSGFQVIHYFSQVGGGMNPYSGLTEYHGFLYGATKFGGEGGNQGTIFRIKPDGSEFSKLHDFNGGNGSYPEAELVISNDVIYGTTTEGGDFDHGVVFRISINGSGFSNLHDFNGTDGARPARGLVRDRDGNLYGMTTYGGANGFGVIYRVDEVGFNKLFDFSSMSGGSPSGALLLREDTFMGTSTIAASVESETRLSVSVHPNPSTDNFNVMVSAPGAEPIQMVITDQYGQHVTTYGITSDIPSQLGSELKRGVYIMKIVQGKQISMQRLVKK